MSNWKERVEEENRREQARVQAEQARVQAEQARVQAEQARIQAERQAAIDSQEEAKRREKTRLTNEASIRLPELFKALKVSEKMREINHDLWRNAGVVSDYPANLFDLESVSNGTGNPIEIFSSLAGSYPSYELQTIAISKRVKGPYEDYHSSRGSGDASGWTVLANGWHTEVVGRRNVAVKKTDKAYGVRIALEFYREDSQEHGVSRGMLGIIAAFSDLPGKPIYGIPKDFQKRDKNGYATSVLESQRLRYYGEPFTGAKSIFSQRLPNDTDAVGKMSEFLDRSLMAFARRVPDLNTVRQEAEVQRQELASRVGRME